MTAIPYEARAKTGAIPHPRYEQAPALPRELEVAAPAVAEVTGARWLRAYSHLLLAGDAACALLAVLAGTVIRFGDADTTPLYVAMLVLFPLLWVSAMRLCRAYESRYLGAGSEEFKRVGNAGVRALAAVATGAYAAHSEIARGYVLLVLPLATALTLLARGGARQYVQRERRLHRRFTHKAVVVGRPHAVLSLALQTRATPQAGFSVVGACLDAPGDSLELISNQVPVWQSVDKVLDAVRRTGADTVAVTAGSELSSVVLRRMAWELEGTGVSLLVAPALTDVAGSRLSIRPVCGLPLLHIEQPEMRGGRRIAKAMLDRSVAAAALLVLSPLLLVLGGLVRVTSRGPALFRQERVGRDGTRFTLWKFRSMVAAAEARRAELVEHNERAEGLLLKIKADPRVTPFGRWLRRYSLDELPQLVNVLRGHMSLVGPRPPLGSEVEQYETDVHRRLKVKPGLTGLWQISGRSDLAWDEAVRLDLMYVENWSLAYDLSILAKTFTAVIRSRGAY